MKRLVPLALPVMIFASYQAHAGDSCTWPTGTQPMTITRVLSGVMHVPLNAAPGEVIGTPDQPEFTQSQPRSELHCYNNGTVLWRFSQPTRPGFVTFMIRLHFVPAAPEKRQRPIPRPQAPLAARSAAHNLGKFP